MAAKKSEEQKAADKAAREAKKAADKGLDLDAMPAVFVDPNEDILADHPKFAKFKLIQGEE